MVTTLRQPQYLFATRTFIAGQDVVADVEAASTQGAAELAVISGLKAFSAAEVRGCRHNPFQVVVTSLGKEYSYDVRIHVPSGTSVAASWSVEASLQRG